MDMADQAGTILRRYGRCPEYSEIFPSDTDLGRSIPNRPRTAAEQVRPRWFGNWSQWGWQDVWRWCGPVWPKYIPTNPQPIRCKGRAGGRVVTISDAGLDVRSKGAIWGTLRKRALFGPKGQDSVSSVSDVAEAQSGWSPDDEFQEEARSPMVDLADVVARLQKEVEEFRAESGYGGSRRSAIPPQPSGWSRFTSTPVPMFAGKTSWDQYRQVFEAIVSSNGWDVVTVALQLVSHLEGDALNVALLVPAPQRVLSGVLLDVLTEYYSSTGRLADNRHQFERVSQTPGEDLSVFAVELETLAIRAFGDLSSSDLRQRSFHRRRWVAMGRRCCVFHVASRVIRLRDVPL